MPDNARFSPLINAPWVRWVDRTEIPSVAVGIAVLIAFLPFYEYNAIAPQMPLDAGAFPPAFALALTFLLLLTRGATRDLQQLVFAGKLEINQLEALAASRRWALIELGVGLVLGAERVYAQIIYAEASAAALLSAGGVVVMLSIVGYTVIQIHLLGFCIRQVVAFRRVARSFDVDLMMPELNNALSNPLIRFITVGFVAVSFAMLLLELVPFASQKARVLEAALIGGLVWIILIVVSFYPLLTLKSRIAVAKSMEITVIRNALKGDFSGVSSSPFGQKLREFSPADLMFYEDRVKNIWEWPVEVHIRRVLIFGLLPPLTWVLAAGVEIAFEMMIVG